MFVFSASDFFLKIIELIIKVIVDLTFINEYSQKILIQFVLMT